MFAFYAISGFRATRLGEVIVKSRAGSWQVRSAPDRQDRACNPASCDFCVSRTGPSQRPFYARLVIAGDQYSYIECPGRIGPDVPRLMAAATGMGLRVDGASSSPAWDLTGPSIREDNVAYLAADASLERHALNWLNACRAASHRSVRFAILATQSYRREWHVADAEGSDPAGGASCGCWA